jgi:hypothetical protein
VGKASISLENTSFYPLLKKQFDYPGKYKKIYLQEFKIWCSHNTDYEGYYLLGYDEANTACCLPILLFDPKDGGRMILQNTGKFTSGYMIIHPRWE